MMKMLRGSAPVVGTLVLVLQVGGCSIEPRPDEGDGDPLEAVGPQAHRPPVGLGEVVIPDATENTTPSFPDQILLAENLRFPLGLVIDDQAVYVMARSDVQNGYAQLTRIDRDSGEQTILATGEKPTQLVGNKDHLFWADAGDGWIRRVDKNGANQVKLAYSASSVLTLAVNDDGTAVWATRGQDLVRSSPSDELGVVLRHFDSTATGLIIDGKTVFVSLFSGEMWRASLDSSEVGQLFAHEHFNLGFVSDGVRLYWIDNYAGTIRTGNLAGGEAHTVANATRGIGFLALSDDHVVWTDHAARMVRRAHKSGTVATETLSAEHGQPMAIATFEGWIAWVNQTHGSILLMNP